MRKVKIVKGVSLIKSIPLGLNNQKQNLSVAVLTNGIYFMNIHKMASWLQRNVLAYNIDANSFSQLFGIVLCLSGKGQYFNKNYVHPNSEIYNLQGQKVQEVNPKERTFELPKQNGLYLIRIQDEEGKVYIEKVIKD